MGCHRAEKFNGVAAGHAKPAELGCGGSESLEREGTGAMDSERRALKPDAQAFDEVRIVTVPRYKTSGMTGDEWRISATIQFYRKGQLIHEKRAGNVLWACVMAGTEYLRAQDDGKGYFAGEGQLCDQEGCHEIATVTLRLKKEFCKDGHESDPYRYDTRPLVRKFCDRHSRRGDCGLEDADRNYEVVTGQQVQPSAEDVKPSTFCGVIPLDPKEAN